MRAPLDHAAVADQAPLHGGPAQAQRRQVAHARVDHTIGTVEVKRRIVAGQGQVGLVVRLDRAQVLPVAVEQVGLHPMRLDAARENLLAEIGRQRRGVEQIDQHLPVEQVNAHARQERPALSAAAAPRSAVLASMGIYLFNRQVLIDLLNAPPLATDFGKEIFPRSIKTHRVQAHLFDGYWEDLGTVKAYHEANLALASNDPPFDFHSPDGVIYTRMRFLPASRLSGAACSSA